MRGEALNLPQKETTKHFKFTCSNNDEEVVNTDTILPMSAAQRAAMVTNNAKKIADLR